MANCVYNLLGRVFYSELELDNFLLNNKFNIQRGKLSDIVFDKPQESYKKTVEGILDEAGKIAGEIKAIQELKALHGADYLTEEQRKKIENYLGVTTALSRGIFKNEQNHLFVPKWIEEFYKNELKTAWKTEGISEEHLKLLNRQPNPDGTPIIITDNEEFNQLFEKLKQAWAKSALIGSAYHKFFELFWKNEAQQKQPTLDEYLKALEDEGLGGILDHDKLDSARRYILNIKDYLQVKHGKNCKFYSEYPITLQTTIDPNKLNGIIDLLVIDEDGTPHIYDYKFSSHNFGTWGRTKMRTYAYQLSFYRAAIQALGIDTSNSTLGIFEFTLNDFNGDTFSGVSPNWARNNASPQILQNSADIPDFFNIDNNVKRVSVIPEIAVHASKDFLENVASDFKKAFPSYRFQKDFDDAVKEGLKKEITYIKSLNQWRVPNLSGTGNLPYVPFESEEKAIAYLDKYHEQIRKAGKSVYQGTINNVKRAIANNDSNILVEFSQRRIEGIEADYFFRQMERYCTPEWEVPEHIEEFEALGILVLHNIRSDYYNFIIIDAQPLDQQVTFKKGKKITGSFIDDITPEQWGIDLLDGTIGNVANMKVMIAINRFPEFFKREGRTAKIGEITVMNPRLQQGRHALSNQLRNNFRIITSYAGIKNNFENGTINFLNAYDLAVNTLFEFGSQPDNFKALNTVYSIYENSEQTIQNNLESLYKLKNELETQFAHLRKPSTINLNAPETVVYQYVMKAIQQLNGVEHVQEVRDGNSVMLKIQAPGSQKSKNLQNLSKTAKEATKNIKREANNFAIEFREKWDKFKKAKGYSTTRRLLFNDETKLFKKMFRDDGDLTGVFKFRNPWTDPELDDAEREFLKWALDAFQRFKHLDKPLSEDTLQMLRNDSESEYYDVPLLINRSLRKKLMTKQGRKGMLTWIKEKIEWWKHPIKNVKQLDIGALTEEDAAEFYDNAEKYKIFDTFQTSDDPDRREILLREKSISSYNMDIGDILLTYAVAKIRKKYLDQYLPILQAYTVTTMFEANANNVDMDDNIDYIRDFVNAKVLDASLVPDKYKAIAKGLATIRKVATVSTLGFSAKSFLFQRLEGVFKNISRSIFKPMGSNQFGWEEYKKALVIVEGSTKDFGKIVNLCQLLNEAYSLNDQDSNTTAARLRQGALPSDFMGQMMWFTSIPDYYNRLTVFIAQAIKDGCFDAHRVEGTKLVYDWKLDKRFSVFANANGVVPTDPEKRKQFFFQKALYIKKMEEFKKSNYSYTNEDGTQRPLQYDPTSNKPGDPLPQAYTFNEANALKSFGDQLYGYYNHEDQMLLKSYLLGASYTQFRAWWSSLRDRWWLAPGVYSRTDGRYEQGVIPVEKKDGNGNIIKDENGNPIIEEKPAYVRYFVDEATGQPTGWELTDENTEVPYIVWKGDYKEGMGRTFLNGLASVFNGDANTPLSEKCIKFVKGNWDPNANPDVQKVRLTNMQLMAHDLLLWAIIGAGLGMLLSNLLKEQRRRDRNKQLGFGDMTIRNAENILVSSMIASTQDLGAINDLISPLTDWTPPSFSIVGNMWKDSMKVISGDETFSRAVLSNLALARQTKEYWWKATAMTKG